MSGILIASALICAYLIGSLPSAYIVGRLRKGIDIRQEGSHNMGAMNVFYNVGFAEGLIVLVLDIGKGVAGVALARFIGVSEAVQLLAGAAVVLGHGFPVFLKFRGGKGGAAVIGILIFLMPWGIPVYLAIFSILTLITRVPTLSYGAAFICFPFIGWLVYHSWQLAVYSVGLVLLVVLRYIPRLLEMRSKGGSWGRVIHRRSLKDRF